jgi:hypothetical protein
VTDDPETTKVYFFSHYLARTDWQGLCFGTLDVGGAKFQHVVSIAAVAEAEKRQRTMSWIWCIGPEVTDRPFGLLAATHPVVPPNCQEPGDYVEHGWSLGSTQSLCHSHFPSPSPIFFPCESALRMAEIQIKLVISIAREDIE